MFEADYPYTATDGNCQWNADLKETGWAVVQDSYFSKEWGVNTVMGVLAQKPINFAFDAHYPEFMAYSGGVFDDDDANRICADNGYSNHTTPLIGYIREETLRSAATFRYYEDTPCRRGGYCIIRRLSLIHI